MYHSSDNFPAKGNKPLYGNFCDLYNRTRQLLSREPIQHKEVFSNDAISAYGGFYDNAGNQTTVTRDGTANARAYNADNELLSTDDGNTTRDAKGNMTEDAEGNKYFYDLDNRINEIQMDGGDTIELAYDALGRRVFRKNGSDETAYLWWGDQETSEHKSSAGVPTIQNDLWAHPTALNKIIARAVDGDKNDIEYYHKNYLDHVYAVSDDSGSIKEHYRYSAFGEVEIYSPAGAKLAVSAIDNGVMWNSRRFDADTGLYYYKYRHYAPQLGRWLGRDPIEERGGINLYGFVGNRPINRWDRLGLAPFLSYKVIEENLKDHQKVCGGFALLVKWRLTKDNAKGDLITPDETKGGLVIQEIDVTYSITDKEGNDVHLSSGGNKLPLKRVHYWEMWEVPYEMDGGENTQFDKFRNPVRHETKGTILIKAYARYYDGAQLSDIPSGYGVEKNNPKTGAGPLPSTTVGNPGVPIRKIASSRSNLVTRELQISWDCITKDSCPTDVTQIKPKK